MKTVSPVQPKIQQKGRLNQIQSLVQMLIICNVEVDTTDCVTQTKRYEGYSKESYD